MHKITGTQWSQVFTFNLSLMEDRIFSEPGTWEPGKGHLWPGAQVPGTLGQPLFPGDQSWSPENQDSSCRQHRQPSTPSMMNCVSSAMSICYVNQFR